MKKWIYKFVFSIVLVLFVLFVKIPETKAFSGNNKIIFDSLVLPNGVKDEIVNNSKVIDRVKKIVLDGTQNFLVQRETTDTILFYLELGDVRSVTGGNIINVDNNFFANVSYFDVWYNNVEGVASRTDEPGLSVNINKFRLAGYNDALTNTQKINLFKAWLMENNITVHYELLEYKEYDLIDLINNGSYDEGYSDGYSIGYNDGYSYGLIDNHAYDVGYNDGYSDGLRSSEGYSFGYDDGYDDGYEDGKEYGINFGREHWYDVGYQAGYNAGINEQLADKDFSNLLRSVFVAIGTFLGINLLPGISIGAIIAVPIVFGIISFILGRKKD